MKFDPYSWLEVQSNVEVQASKGRLQLRVSAPCPLYVTAQGVEALVGVSTEFTVEVAEEITFRLDAPEGVRVFVYDPVPTAVVADGEVFTNIDRMVSESGMLQEVTRARRQLEFERRAMLREIRETAETVQAQLRAENEAMKQLQTVSGASPLPADVTPQEPPAADDKEAKA